MPPEITKILRFITGTTSIKLSDGSEIDINYEGRMSYTEYRDREPGDKTVAPRVPVRTIRFSDKIINESIQEAYDIVMAHIAEESPK